MQWNEIFKKEGKVFTKIQEDIPKVLKLFKRHNVKRILDLGCGSGRHTVYFAKRGFDVYGIDNAEEGLNITKSWLRKEGLKANLKLGSIYDKLQYPDNFFDAAISTHTIHHERLKNIRKLIRELRRVLKPGGLIFITVRKMKFRKGGFTMTNRFRKQKIRYKMIESRTFVPIEGEEKGLIHYFFNKGLLRKEFMNFKICNMWVNSDKRHYCLFGKLKNIYTRRI